MTVLSPSVVFWVSKISSLEVFSRSATAFRVCFVIALPLSITSVAVGPDKLSNRNLSVKALTTRVGEGPDQPVSRYVLSRSAGICSRINSISIYRVYSSTIVMVLILSPSTFADPGSRGETALIFSIPLATCPKTG